MSALPVAPDVWRITTPLPFRPRQVHAYLLRDKSDRFALVDGGIDTDEAWAALREGVEGVVGDLTNVMVHLVTHMHLDHLGLARRVRGSCGAPLAMSRLDAERAAHAAAFPDEEAEYRATLLRENGAPPPMRDAVERSRAQSAPLAPFVAADRMLDGTGGDLPEVAGWRWIWTPGHTAGHLSLFRPRDGVLVAGDAVLPRITATIGVNRQRGDPVADYLGTLDGLAALAPALLLPGHGDPIQQPLQRIRELRAATQEESRRVLDLLGSDPLPAWEVALRRHPDPGLPDAVRMLALREVRAHLDHLVADAAARGYRTPEGVWAFVRATSPPR